MDWNSAIERNREALKRVLAALVAMAGLAAVPSDGPATLPRRLHRAVLRLLRPTESAVRRLVIVAARGLVVPPPRPRKPRPKPKSVYVRDRRSTGIFVPRGVPIPGAPARQAPTKLALPLFDAPRRLFRKRRPAASGVPRISVPGYTVPFPVPPRRPPAPDDPLDATRIALRLDALGRALDDLPGQARRFARWRARSNAAWERECREPADTPGGQSPVLFRPRRVWPLRAGRPPGTRRRSAHEVHAILRELHGLAFDVLVSPDTS